MGEVYWPRPSAYLSRREREGPDRGAVGRVRGSGVAAEAAYDFTFT
jgi:hypothetical protein